MEGKLVGGKSGTGGRGQPNLEKEDVLSGKIRFSLYVYFFFVSKIVCDEVNTVISVVKMKDATSQGTVYVL